jgi:hypothetical protein
MSSQDRPYLKPFLNVRHKPSLYLFSYDNNTNGGWNDFGLDEIKLMVPELLMLLLLGVGLTGVGLLRRRFKN